MEQNLEARGKSHVEKKKQTENMTITCNNKPLQGSKDLCPYLRLILYWLKWQNTECSCFPNRNLIGHVKHKSCSIILTSSITHVQLGTKQALQWAVCHFWLLWAARSEYYIVVRQEWLHQTEWNIAKEQKQIHPKIAIISTPNLFAFILCFVYSKITQPDQNCSSFQ